MEYSFHFYNSLSETGIMMALNALGEKFTSAPVVLCIGSDLAIGDSLGPLVGTKLKERKDFNGFLYGSLNNPVTAKEVKYINNFLKATHPSSPVIAVDAAVGNEADVGLIKVSDAPLRPGAGANKRLGKVGDLSVLGIMTGKSAFSYSALTLTRLNMVYGMAEVIAGAIAAFSFEREQKGQERA